MERHVVKCILLKTDAVLLFFGDGGVAALIERDVKYGRSIFSLNSDGSRADLIMIPGGGYRHMSSADTIREKVVDEYGNIRSDEQGYMKGEMCSILLFVRFRVT